MAIDLQIAHSLDNPVVSVNFKRAAEFPGSPEQKCSDIVLQTLAAGKKVIFEVEMNTSAILKIKIGNEVILDKSKDQAA